MAETVLSFVLDQLSTFLREEGRVLGGLRQEVQFIRDELGHMRAFLREAEANEEDAQPRLQEWIKQVREAAYDTEDILDEFVARFARHRTTGFYGSFRRIFSSIKNLRARHRVASQIQSIKFRINSISEGHQRYQSEYGISAQASSSLSAVNNTTWRYSGDDALLVEEAKLVGIDQPKKHLISQLLQGDDYQLKVVSVVGMGGLGKTTLVKKVHEDLEVRRHFPVRAWVTISETCDFQYLLIDLIRQLHEEGKKPVPQSIESMTTTELKKIVKDFLQQAGRYAIVFDDVWDVEFWNTIKFALPESSHGNRVMLTTRRADVASASCIESRRFVYRMEPLSFEDSWTLFCNKIFKGNSCPGHLMDVAKGILDKCEGLPLAILAISGLLASKDVNRIEEWEMVRRSLRVELEGTGKLDRVKKILFLSYSDLPWHLKICLLYTSIYPEDYKIGCLRLVNLWIAERFVEWREGMNIEDVAWSYLSELVNRSLIQVTGVFYEGMPGNCRIHDLLREIIISKSREQNMVTITTGQPTRWPSEKVRRLIVHTSSSNNTQHHEQTQNYCFDHLRSFITIGSTSPLLSRMLLSEVSRGSKLLKVLGLRGQKTQKEIPNEIFKMFHLKHLDLYGTGVERVPKGIGKLQHLEYLNLGNTGVGELPIEILKLQKLRVLKVYQRVDPSDDDYGRHGFKALFNMGGLLSLEILSCMDASSGCITVREIGNLTQLRELAITKLRRDDGKELCSSLANLTNLHKLSVYSIGKGDDHEIIDLNHHNPSLSSSSCSFLQSLRMLILCGRLEKMPQWVAHLHSLVRIDLDWSRLRGEEDPLESLQHLPNLVNINFCGSYQGEGLCFKTGGFLMLKRLHLKRMEGLRWMRVEEGALPRLETLFLQQLPLLEELPLGIQHLSHLQRLSLYEMSSQLREELLENQKEESEDYTRIAHIPEILIGYYTDDWKWREHQLWEKKKKKT
ncbi:disease resistance protein RPM1-like [Coffea eugenioides]|uniref:disease resistance protein RPM1-like n=1 Tax=Coffea eugenioides TaxID=49369 RepID=UPI000F604C5E|nr:disease resistance protein RPM1-like [Coffea eugenioides]XP_027180442.1 disease resistance protein RPM1-like [Coffea eugenioides]XP_027180443.1 disease resistance protein RPM1-like [Coffea eugenioides]XP_027180450.1 disease resistance protein RPM1-like [Coffea eugenioides]XP_027180451.1 disease resistance protein RPM1-like [Coffea eugenioides]